MITTCLDSIYVPKNKADLVAKLDSIIDNLREVTIDDAHLNLVPVLYIEYIGKGGGKTFTDIRTAYADIGNVNETFADLAIRDESTKTIIPVHFKRKFHQYLIIDRNVNKTMNLFRK